MLFICHDSTLIISTYWSIQLTEQLAFFLNSGWKEMKVEKMCIQHDAGILALSKCQYQDSKTEFLISSSQDNIQTTTSLRMLHENRIKITPVSFTLYYVYPIILKILRVTLSKLNQKHLRSEWESTKYITSQGHILTGFITPALHHPLKLLPYRLTSGEILLLQIYCS